MGYSTVETIETCSTCWVINPVSGMVMGRVPEFDYPEPEDGVEYNKALDEYWECVVAIYGDGVYLCEAVMGDYTESERKLMRDCQCWEVIDL